MATTLEKFFELGEHEKLFHPDAIQKYRQFLDDIRKDVPLDKLTNEDPKQFLSDFNYWQYEQCVKSIKEWQEECLLSNYSSTLSVYRDTSLFWGTWSFKALLVKVHQRKQGQQILLAAHKKIEEQARLAKVEEQAQLKQAQLKHDQYIDRLSAAVEKVRAELSKSKKPKFVHPPELVKYEPDNWCELELPTNQRIQKWAESKIFERLPEILTNLTKWKLNWQSQVVPRAVYEVVNSIPCLTWYFDTHILVTASLELKKCVIREHHPYYTADVQGEGEKLGVLYLEQPEWLTPGCFTTPIALLSLLAKGDLEAPGITVTAHGYLSTTFAIQGFEEEVEVYDDFRKFIRDIAKDKPLAETLLSKGLIDTDTAKLVKEKAMLMVQQSLGTGETFSDDSDVITKLEGMGYKNGDIEGAMEATKLSPEMSLEEKVETVLKFLDSNSL